MIIFLNIIQTVLIFLMTTICYAGVMIIFYTIFKYIKERRYKKRIKRIDEAQKAYQKYVKKQQYDREHYPLFFWKEKI